MALSIQPLQEADIPAFVRIELEAFKSHPRIPMLWPRGYTPDLYAFYEQRKTQTFHDDDSRMLKAVDADSGKIVACSEWTFALDPHKTADSNPIDPNEQPPPNYPEGGRWAITRFFKNGWEKWRRETLAGKAYIRMYSLPEPMLALYLDAISVLDILVVNPAFQGQGAGKQLLLWGCEQADKLGVPVVLESTPTGLRLYQSFGFEQVKVLAADMKQFGVLEPYDEEAAKRFWMMRQPQAAM